MNLQELQKLVRAKCEQVKQEPTEPNVKVAEVLKFMHANYEFMTPDAQQWVDKITSAIVEAFGTVAENLPDGQIRRQIVRTVAMASDAHHKAESLLDTLSNQVPSPYTFVTAAPPVFCRVLQYLLDVLFDATRQTSQGIERFAVISLHYWCVDELLVAFHLASRGYSSQAYSHIRTTYETLDKIKLFRQQPQWAEVWAGADSKKIWNELRPAKVREKLGKSKDDPIYAFFSKLGTHATYSGVKARTYYRPPRTSNASYGFTIYMGGVDKEEHLAFAISYSIMATVSVLFSAIVTFGERLNEQDVMHNLDEVIEAALSYQRDHFVVWAKKAGMDVESLLSFFENRKRVIDFFKSEDPPNDRNA
jgi:hypothetical protein